MPVSNADEGDCPSLIGLKLEDDEERAGEVDFGECSCSGDEGALALDLSVLWMSFSACESASFEPRL